MTQGGFHGGEEKTPKAKVYRDKKKNYKSSGTVVLAQCTVNSSARLQPCPTPTPEATSDSTLPSFQRSFLCSWELRTLALSTTNFNLKNSGPSLSAAEAPPSFLLKGPSLHLTPPFPPGGEGAHLPGLHHGRLPDQLHGKGPGDGDMAKGEGLGPQ